MEDKDGDCNWCSANSDLPCMHLDPGVNRLGLNVTSIHQTDRRPVTPDIVFPICVILWPWEEGLKKGKQQNNNKKKRSIYFTNTLKDQRSVRSLPSGKKSVITNEQTESMQIREGGKGFRWAEDLWESEGRGGSYAGRPVCSEHKHLIQKSHSVILQTRWSCFLKGRNDNLIGSWICRQQNHTELINIFRSKANRTGAWNRLWFLMHSKLASKLNKNGKLKCEVHNISSSRTSIPTLQLQYFDLKRKNTSRNEPKLLWCTLGCTYFKVLPDKSRSELHYKEQLRVLWLLSGPSPEAITIW